MFSTGVYFKIWGVVNKGNYSEVDCSTSAKNRQTGNYETDFSSKFVRFIGNAHKKNPTVGERIKVTSCGVQNVYEKDGQRQYLKNPTYIVFDFEREGAAPNAPTTGYMPTAYGGDASGFAPLDMSMDGDLPF
jgi:hypothetical protein